ncbi:MAG: radical SAM protein [Methanothrix sp.]
MMIRVNLGGIVPLSTVDWPGRAATVVFLRGCPLRCPHCQNPRLQSGERYVPLHYIASRIVSEVKGLRGVPRHIALFDGSDSETSSCRFTYSSSSPAGHSSSSDLQISIDEAVQRAHSKPFVDTLVLSGGEPLLQLGACVRLLRLGKSMDLKTGIETSGVFPENLQKLLEDGLVDRVFIDIKTSLHEPDYEVATGRGNNAPAVLSSLEICFRSGVSFEARSTVFPNMPSESQLVEIAEMLCSLNDRYPQSSFDGLTLQQGHPREGEKAFAPISAEAMQEIAASCRAACHEQLLVRVHAAPTIALKN